MRSYLFVFFTFLDICTYLAVYQHKEIGEFLKFQIQGLNNFFRNHFVSIWLIFAAPYWPSWCCTPTSVQSLPAPLLLHFLCQLDLSFCLLHFSSLVMSYISLLIYLVIFNSPGSRHGLPIGHIGAAPLLQNLPAPSLLHPSHRPSGHNTHTAPHPAIPTSPVISNLPSSPSLIWNKMALNWQKK